MTQEAFNKAIELKQKISEAEMEIPKLETRIKRFNDYINFMDGRIKPIVYNGKIYKKVEIIFNINKRVTDIDTRDLFDLVEENKKDFIDFLKKCQKNYEKRLNEVAENITKMELEFSSIGSNENKLPEVV